jgi:enamine deaminase RidA (YjgF/YER057c/UK114 family)
MSNLATALAAGGAALSDVVKTTVYVATSEAANLVAVSAVVRDAFGDHDPPSTLVGVTVLGYREQLVEVEAIAAVAAETRSRE